MGLNGLFVFCVTLVCFVLCRLRHFCALGGFSVWTPVGTDASLDNNGNVCIVRSKMDAFFFFPIIR